MKPIFRDANGALVYDNDEYITDWSMIDDDVKLCFDEERGIYCRSGIDESSGIPVKNWATLKDVSSKTNFERYFADLCEFEDVWKYICKGAECRKCAAYGVFCDFCEPLNDWLENPAVDLAK